MRLILGIQATLPASQYYCHNTSVLGVPSRSEFLTARGCADSRTDQQQSDDDDAGGHAAGAAGAAAALGASVPCDPTPPTAEGL